MARQPRSEVFKPNEVGVYHAYNRTVRRSWLHGIDPLTGADHSHRREWFRNRMKFLAQYFCLDILAFAILSNHWHIVIRNRPDLVSGLTDREVAVRWLSLTYRGPTRSNQGGEIREPEIEAIVNNPQRLGEVRRRLSDISWYVRLMCQTIARQCNVEDECSGHFFEDRFDLEPVEEESHVLACMAYTDLNPLRAGMVDSLDDPTAHVSISERLRDLDDQSIDPSSWLAPLELANEVDGLPVVVVNHLSAEEVARRREELAGRMGCLPMSLESYRQLLWHLALESRPELQAKLELTAADVQSPLWADGTPIDVKAIGQQMAQMSETYDASIRGHACKAIRRLQAAAAQVEGDSLVTS